MRSNQYLAKQIRDEIGGTHTVSSSQVESPQVGDMVSDAVVDAPYLDDLYLPVMPPVHHHKHNPQSINTKLKVKRLSEERLIQISEELMQLAEKIRYFHPLMAEAIDEAWDSTEEALRILSRDELW